MKNLEQVRAMNALGAVRRMNDDQKARGDKGGDVLTGFPALIVNNGLLSTLAFSRSKSKESRISGHELICDEIARHLATEEIRLLDCGEPNAEKLINHLVESDSVQLRLCTAEALAYLNYLRRFAKVEDGEGA